MVVGLSSLLWGSTNSFAYRTFGSPLSRVYRGIGCFLAFHRVLDNLPDRRVGDAYDIEITARELERAVERIRKNGYAIVPIDEAIDVLERGRGRGRFCVLTFDDGYTDWLTKALPVLASLDAPFTAYVTSGYPDRTTIPWQCVLEKVLLETSMLRVVIDGREELVTLADEEARDEAFFRLLRILEGRDTARASALAKQLYDPQRNPAISWDELARLASHRLVTIGAHTVTHPVLSALSEEDVLREMRESRKALEARLDKVVRHFSYPFGTSSQVTARELRLAAHCGYASAATMRLSNIFPRHADHRMAIPRIWGSTADEIDLRMSGVVSAIRHRGRRVVTL